MSPTEIAGGAVSGVWTRAGSPYHINGEITVPNESTLVIEPGVEVLFTGHYKLNVQGRLIAVGTSDDSITFSAQEKQYGWHGIRFVNTPGSNDTSMVVYCAIRDGRANTGASNGPDRCGGAIYIRGFDRVIVSHSLFESNSNYGDIAAATGGAAIYVANASPTITHNTFRRNVGTTDCAILCWYSNARIADNIFSNNTGPHGPIFCGYNAPTISGNVISRNVTNRAGGGIFTMTSRALITDNIIVHNRSYGMEGEGGGIKCWINDQATIINNTIAYNTAAHGGGICCNSNSDPVFVNNIIWGNTSPDGDQVNLLDTQSDPHFLYCDIEGRKDGFGGNGGGANYGGIYESNIDLDPLFSDTSAADFSLQDASHCIGAGFDSAEVSGVWYHAPPRCIGGAPRPNPAGTRPDIGACESPLGTPTTSAVHAFAGPARFLLHQNYPNPFNPSTTIRYELPERSHVTLAVFDALGRQVATLVKGEVEAGYHDVNFDATNLASGVYLYRLTAGGYVQARRLVYLR
jgi:hypothetical protein